MSLPAFSVRQVVLVNLLFLLLMVAGIQAARQIPVDLFPDISFNSASLNTVWPGASPSEVERLVTKKLEDEIDGISAIKEMYSFSSQGLSQIEIEWKETLSEIEYEAALNDLRAAIDRVDDLPPDAEAPIMRELSVSENFNILMVAVSDVGVGEYTTREVARDLADRLERIPGLRHAELRGARDREIQVLVDRNRALQYDLTLADIHRIIAENNQNFAGGSFTDSEDREVTVRGLGNFQTAENLAQTVVKKSPRGTHVVLGDVARIEDSFEKRLMLGRFNGKPTVILGISKESDTDIIDLVATIRAYVEDYTQTLPEGILVEVTWDQAAYVDARMDIMRNNLMVGIAFVVFILWLTLGFRNAMLAIVGVPFSFLTALVLFPIFDITINSLSLVGFIMVSGMVVDDAIIILENIYRHIEAGTPLRQAIIRGSEEVMWPVTAAIVTTCAAFIPMLTVSGTSGEFMEILPKTVVVVLLGSLLEAVLILPAHYLDFGSRTAASAALPSAATGLSRWSYAVRTRVDGSLERFRDAYLRVQARFLENRWPFLAVSVAALYFAIGLMQHVAVDLFPSDFNNVIATFEGPTDTGIDQSEQVVIGLEQALEPIRHELTDVTTYAGLAMNSEQRPIRAVNQGMMYISFPNTHQNIADPKRVLNMVREKLESYRAAHPGTIVNLRVRPPRNGPPIGKPVAVRIQADDYGEAKEIAERMKAELATMAGVYNIEDNVPVGPRELRIALDEHRASLHDLTFGDVGFALRAANDGVVPSTFKDATSDEDVDIRVLLRPEQRRSIADLLEVELRAPDGHLVRLGDVATVELARGYERLYHYDAQRTVVVYADVDGEQASSVSVNEALRKEFRDISRTNPGVNLVFGGEFQATDDAFADMRRAFLLAVMAIFGILAVQFRSYLQPFIVMSVIAFSFIGVALGMFVMGYALSMYVLYALVGLAGIVVNDSLVLIDFVNRSRRQGASPMDAVAAASKKRFRPILLTTITTIIGLLPMALGITGYSRVFGPFSAAIVFGLATASFLTLFVVPTLYLVLEDARSAVLRRIRGAAVGAPTPAAGADAL